MKSVCREKYCNPIELEVHEIDQPILNDDLVLVKVHASSANPLDWHMSDGKPYLIRLTKGFFKPKNKMLGADMAGVVEKVGENVSKFKIGDRVYGDIEPYGSGAYSEYVAVPEKAIASIPDSVSFEEAAAIPIAGLTAIQAIRNFGEIKEGQNVLINGASGGVGTFAVQLAKVFGATVTGVCSGKNVEMVKSIGADQVIDYTKEDFTKNGIKYDLLVDVNGNLKVSEIKKSTTPTGTGVLIGFQGMGKMMASMFRVAINSNKKGQKFHAPLAEANLDDLKLIVDLIAEKKVKSIINKVVPLENTGLALEECEKGHVSGKIVIKVSD